jgi:hypothetical protein
MAAKFFGFLLFVLTLSSCQGQSNSTNLSKQNEEKSINGHFIMPPIPSEIDFAGEKINLSDLDIRERLDKELHAIVFYHNLIITYFKRANRYMPQIESILKENGIPDDFKYLALIESGYDNIESRSGAHGFWQFMPKTAEEYGLTVSSSVDERQDLQKSTEAAAKYLKKAKQDLGSWIEAAASYNRGVGGVRSDQKWQHVNSYFDAHMNNETARYVFRILAAKLIFENPLSYGYDLNEIELYPVIETKSVKVNTEINDLALWAKEQGINYKILVKLNPWILSNSLKFNSVGYTFLLPKDNSQYSNYGSK